MIKLEIKEIENIQNRDNKVKNWHLEGLTKYKKKKDKCNQNQKALIRILGMRRYITTGISGIKQKRKEVL